MIWTVGHSTRSLSEFLELLAGVRIEAIADVRSLPGSRRFPYFNAETLRNALESSGIEYVHIKELGGRRKARSDSPHTVWRHKAFRGYADYMDTREFLEGIEQLLDLAKRRRTAMMCAEALWWHCHRSMIADHLKSISVTVEHIMDIGKTVGHPYTAAASIENGRLVYGAE